MISEYELANIITGTTRAEGGVARKSSATILGKAVENSENGMVRVVPEGDVFAPDGDNTIIIPTSPSVRAGDTVQIGLVGGVSKRPMVVAAGGEGDRQDSAITSAANAAQVAWNYADSAHTAANQAKTAAQNAEADAARAEEAAQQAVEDAATANDAAEQAVEDAGTAYQAAQDAQTSANDAAEAAQQAQEDATTAKNAANQAKEDATTAKNAANQAKEDATAAKNSATQANTHANSALTQLSVIEDVAGTLDWISKHGTYTLTSDTTVQEGTVYFEKVGNDYVPIAEPEGNPHAQGWYTLDVTDSQSDYIMAHLAVTSAGLWVLPSGIGSASDEQHAAGYKTLLSSTGMTIYDGTGRAVATYGEGIVFDSSRELKIGNNNAYIEYYDSNGDEIADSLRISANSITLGGSDIADTYATKDEAATMGEGSGESVTVDSGARLRSLEVEGKSVQDGTPSPSAPVPIQVVGGANLLNKTSITAGTNVIVTQVSNGVNVAATNSQSYRMANVLISSLGLVNGASYIITTDATVNSGAARIAIRNNASSNIVSTSTYTSSSQMSLAFTYDSSTMYEICFFCTYGTAAYGNVSYRDIMLNVGSTAMPYVPYGSIGLKVSGKNLLYSPLQEPITRTVTNGYYENWTADGGFINRIYLEAGKTYTLSFDVATTLDPFNVAIGAGNGTYARDVYQQTRQASGHIAVTFTPTAQDLSSGRMLAFRPVRNGSATTFTYTVSNLMLEEGATATDYTPYVDSLTEIPLAGYVLASLPDGTKDVLSVDASGHCVITKRTGKVVLDGSSVSFTYNSNITHHKYYYSSSLDSTIAEQIAGSYTGLCDRLVVSSVSVNNISNSDSTKSYISMGGSASKLRVMMKTSLYEGTAASALNTWLASNNATAYYKLATPTTVDLGYITMPELADGCTVQILASLTPTFGASWYTENGAALADFATKSELQVTADGITSTVATNYTSKDEFAANKSVRFKLLRDSWTESNWAAQESLGRSANWSNIHKNSAGADVQTGYDFSTLHVGDLIVAEGMATDSKAPHSILLSVETVPTTATGVANCTVVSFVSSKQLATRIKQTESEISLQAKRIEEADNLLYDTDVSGLTKVNAPADRYWSDASNTMITPRFVSISDPPVSGIGYAAEFVCDGTQTARKGRGLRFYNGNGNLIPLVAGQTYTASWWARCTEGTGQTCSYMSDSSKSGGLIQSDFIDLSTAWTRVTATYTPVSFGASAYCYFHAFFPANTAGKIQLCGFKLVAGDSAENVSAELSVQADKIAMVVDDSTTSSSLVLTSQAMDYIGDHVEIKGTDGTSTVISGGQIQTGSLTIGAMSSSTQADILNSNIEVGGTNLLWESGTFDGWMTRGGTSGVSVSDGVWTVTMSGYTSNTNKSKRQWIGSGLLANYWGKYIVISFDIMSPNWSAVEEGSYTGLNAVSMQICTDTAAPHGGAIGSTGRYHFSRLGNGTANAQIWSHTPETVTNGEWLHFVSKPLLVDETLFNYDTTKVDGYTGWLFEVMLRRNGTISVRHPQIEIGNKPTSWSPAPEDGIAYVDSLQVSSTNLIRNGDFSNGTAYWVRKTDVTFSTETDSTYGTVLKAVQAAAASSTARVYPDTSTNFTHATGETYTVSFYAKADAANTIKVDRGFSATEVYLNESIGTSWKRYTGTLTSGGTGTISFSLGSAGTLYLAKVMLVRGDKYMDWSPDPRDVKGGMQAIYGTCSAAAGTAAKDVTCANFQLFTGARIAVKFSTASTVAAPTLNVNGTGAKAIWYNNAVASTSNPVLWGANATLNFVYDGTEWVLDEKPPSYFAGCSTAAGTRDKAATVTGALVVNGTTLTLNCSTANTYASGSVRINLSSIGAKDVWVNRAVTSSTNKLLWAANTVLTFVQSGGAWAIADSGMRKNITHISDNGVSIHAANNPTQNYLQLDSSEIGFYESGSKIARFKAKEIDLGLAPSGPSGADLATKIAMNGGMFSIESSLTEPATSGGTDYQNSLTVMRARSDLLDNWQMTIDDKAFLTMSEMNYGYQTTLRVDGKTQPLVAGVDATSSKTDNTGTLALYGGRILGQTTTNRMGDPIAGYSITRVYTGQGFRVENTSVAVSNDVVTVPITFAADSSITWGDQVAASIDPSVAPPTQIRVFVYARNSWTGPLVPAWININNDGTIRINSDAAIVWFGYATYVRKPAGWTAS